MPASSSSDILRVGRVHASYTRSLGRMLFCLRLLSFQQVNAVWDVVHTRRRLLLFLVRTSECVACFEKEIGGLGQPQEKGKNSENFTPYT